jgi:DNA-binding MurR/RpiR family transcriptional regulator
MVDLRGPIAQGGLLTRHANTAPETFDDLVAVIQEQLPSLTPSQRLLAEHVMVDPEGIAFMTVSELAAAVGVNESTVVRFASALGLDGYPGLTRLCRAKLRDEAQLLRRFSNLESLARESDDPLELAAALDPLELATAFDQANIVRTLARVDRASWSATVAALAEAPRVHILGLRKCYTVAFLLGYLLRMFRDDVETLSPGAGTLVEDLRRVQPGDCFVAISIHRYSRDTVRGFDWARSRGATTIALTDNPSSPLARGVDHPFYVDTTGVAVLRSMTAFIALAQTMASAVAAARGAETRDALTLEEQLLDQLGTYEPGD